MAEQTKSMTLLGVVRKSKAERFGLPSEQRQKEKVIPIVYIGSLKYLYEGVYFF